MTPWTWYLNRGSGVVSLVLFTVAVVLGLTVTARTRLPGLPRFAVVTLHRNLSLLSLVFLTVHGATAVLDSYVDVPLVSAVVPFTSTYEPWGVGLGALALDLLLALAVTGLLQRRIGWARFRRVHWLAYACWPIALLHGVLTGTDLLSGWTRLLTLLCWLAPIAAAGWRWTRPSRRRPMATNRTTATPTRAAATQGRAGMPAEPAPARQVPVG